MWCLVISLRLDAELMHTLMRFVGREGAMKRE